MRRFIVPVLAIFTFLGLLGFWGDTAQSILGALTLLGFLTLSIEVLFGRS